jgi:hypothetical protein
MAVEFVDQLPPRNGTAASEHDKIAKELKANPGQWARVQKGLKTAAAASTINTAGANAYAPRGSYEATARKNDKGSYDVYARYVGDAGVKAASEKAAAKSAAK